MMKNGVIVFSRGHLNFFVNFFFVYLTRISVQIEIGNAFLEIFQTGSSFIIFLINSILVNSKFYQFILFKKNIFDFEKISFFWSFSYGNRAKTELQILHLQKKKFLKNIEKIQKNDTKI